MDHLPSVKRGEELAEFRGRFELRNRVQSLERRREGVGETPDGPGVELRILRVGFAAILQPAGSSARSSAAYGLVGEEIPIV